ncbi:hypothetical protein GA0070610_1023 [Micromonospora echinofusca]|uniref:Uncharacterized protein n=1 Tax=Micromonospora echinofusca TaxID=47858 RepID=A0A1C5G516_MICEH|nr:hypothetical protein [Micromonospora echinofusca]SCG14808.1 hypothetical protein GA0070610_1023 [Micromonospora echinofusca]
MSRLEFQSRRQAGLAALYLGVFATIWFSVPAAEQPLRAVLVVASGAALVTAVVGAVVVARSRATAADVARDRAADRRYLLIVLAEFAAAGLGAVLLALVGWSEFIPVLICAVVGLHFFPLVPVLRDPVLWLLGAAMCVVALAGLVSALATAVSAGLVVGTGAGLLLLAYAVLVLLRAARQP